MAIEKDKGLKPQGTAESQAIHGQLAPGGSTGAVIGEKPVGRHRSTDDSFIGRAAQLAVMAELLRRHCNAAIPEVDLGTDVFAFKDDREEVVRLQVKACTKPRDYRDQSGFSSKFNLPMKQFERQDDRPPLYYALAVLRDSKWGDFLVVSRTRLQAHFNGIHPFGFVNKKNNNLEITVEFREQVTCSGQNLTDCRNAWESLPPLKGPIDPEAAAHGEAGLGGPADAPILPQGPRQS